MRNSHLKATYFILLTSYFLSSCSVEKQIAKSANADVIKAKPLQAAHVGISIYDPSSGKYLYNYQGDKYFVPASNTKIPTCYAAMKYLGDSLVGLRYNNNASHNNADFEILPTGDPTFLHPDFKRQPVLQFFNTNKSKIFSFNYASWTDDHLGSGWSWNDYDAAYMAERSPMPLYGNVVTFKRTGTVSYKILSKDSIELKGLSVIPPAYINQVDLYKQDLSENYFSISRSKYSNRFEINEGNSVFSSTQVPFINRNGIETAALLLQDSIGFPEFIIYKSARRNKKDSYTVIHSQPTDSLLKPMMHRSDNFFAEQSLLMVSNELLGVMNDSKIIDTILKTDFKDLPQKPRWVDGSGLSRYNLFTPQDFVTILDKMQKEFPMARIQEIFPTGGEGTISSYYKADAGFIFGKTGTLSGVVAFSGFMYTKKGRLLIFSTLVNNHQASATEVRRAVEGFLQGVRNRY